MRDTPADLISFKMGINVVNTDAMRLRAFTPALHGFLTIIREAALLMRSSTEQSRAVTRRCRRPSATVWRSIATVCRQILDNPDHSK